jgi:hypothetical protein
VLDYLASRSRKYFGRPNMGLLLGSARTPCVPTAGPYGAFLGATSGGPSLRSGDAESPTGIVLRSAKAVEAEDPYLGIIGKPPEKLNDIRLGSG